MTEITSKKLPDNHLNDEGPKPEEPEAPGDPNKETSGREHDEKSAVNEDIVPANIKQKDLEINIGYLAGLLLTLLVGSFHNGFDLAIYGSCWNLYKEMYEWSEDEEDLWSMLPSLITLSMAALVAMISKYFIVRGRRFTVFCAAFTNILSTVFIVCAQWPEKNRNAALTIFLIGRVILGVSMGLYLSIIAYFINEVSPESKRNYFACLAQTGITLGIFSSFLFSIGFISGTPYELSHYYLWRVAISVPTVLAIIQVVLLTFVFTYDTPQYYISVGKYEKALEAIKTIFVNNEQATSRLNSFIRVSKKAEENKMSEQNLYSKYKRALWVGLFVSAFQQLSGINTYCIYAPIIFDKQSYPEVLSAIMSAIQVLFALLTLLVIERLGRRPLLVSGAIMCTLGNLLCCVSFSEEGDNTTLNWIFNVGVFIYAGFFNTGFGTMTWLYLAEILPPTWMGYATAVNWIFGIILAVVSPYCINYIGRWTFFILMMMTVIAAVFFWFFVLETKGKNIEEIRRLFESPGSDNVVPSEDPQLNFFDPQTARTLKEEAPKKLNRVGNSNKENSENI